MTRKFQGLSSVRRNLAAAALLGGLVLGAAPAFGPAVRTPSTEKIDTRPLLSAWRGGSEGLMKCRGNVPGRNGEDVGGGLNV